MAKKEAASSTATGRTSTASKARSTKAESSAPPATGMHKKIAVPAQPEVKAAATVVREPSHQDIARRAFELFQARGGYEGGAINDWLRAEQELRAKHP